MNTVEVLGKLMDRLANAKYEVEGHVRSLSDADGSHFDGCQCADCEVLRGLEQAQFVLNSAYWRARNAERERYVGGGDPHPPPESPPIAVPDTS